MNSPNYLLLILDQQTFEVLGTVKVVEDVNCAMFSDGISIGAIVPAREVIILTRCTRKITGDLQGFNKTVDWVDCRMGF